MNLYELTDQYLMLMEMGEDPDVDRQTFLDTMESIEGDYTDKLEGYGKVIRSFSATAEALRKEAAELTAKAQRMEKRAQDMKEAVKSSMMLTGRRKVNAGIFTFSIRENAPSVVLDEPYIENIPEDYLRYKDPDVDRQKIKKAIEAGEDITWAHLERSKSLIIK